ncbi:hypothetical protein U3516DRAFT_675938 [Neocallimastix sp. 'constans']
MRTFPMIIAENEGLNLKGLLPNKELQELLIKPKDNKSITTRCTQSSGNSLGKTLTSESQLQPESPQLPYGSSSGTNLARNNLPMPQQARQPYRRCSIHRNVRSITVLTLFQR